MITVRTNDEQVFQGTDEKDVVRQMRDMQWGVPQLKRDWMAEAAERAMIVTGFRIRGSEGASIFLRDLERAGLLTLERA